MNRDLSPRPPEEPTAPSGETSQVRTQAASEPPKGISPSIAAPGRDATGSTSRGRMPTVRPPILASEALRREMIPEEPDATAGRLKIAAISVLAISLCAFTDRDWRAGILVALMSVIFVGVLLPIAYQMRASLLLGTGALGWGLCVALGDMNEPVPAWPLLSLSVAALGMGLMYRSAHRASRESRIVVLVALLATLFWVAAVGAAAFVQLPTALHSVAAVALGLLLVLSLLAFMPSNATGASRVWATALLLWLLGYFGLIVLVASEAGKPVTGGGWVGWVGAASICTAAIAGFQLLAARAAEAARANDK